MKPHYLTLILLVCLSHSVQAQAIAKTFGAQAATLGGIGTIIDNGFEVFNNPSMLARNKSSKLSFYQEVPFLQKPLQLSGLCYQRSDKLFASGFGLTQSGNEYFNQQILSIAFGKKLSEHLYLGTGLQFLQIHQYQLPAINSIYSTIGVFIKLNEKWCIGSTIVNVNAAAYKTEIRENLPSILRLGVSYQFNEYFVILAEQEPDIKYGGHSKLGLAYKMNESFHLNFGWRSNPQHLSFGICYTKNKTKWILGASHHRDLGLTPFVEFQFLPGKIK